MMKVTLIGYTTFDPPVHVSWRPNDDMDMVPDPQPFTNEPRWGGSSLVEFAGRACYQSWERPNPETATNAGYLQHILEVGHLSVLEHASATFYVEGVSRSLTHELVRHRHLSYSQLSQRFVNEDRAGEYVVPPVLRTILESVDETNVDRQLIDETLKQVDTTVNTAYGDLVELLAANGFKRKQAREAARCVLPNMTETKIVVTGNYRAWRHFIDLRASLAADAEIRLLALEVLRRLRGVAPNVFGDYVLDQLDGVAYARPGRTSHIDG